MTATAILIGWWLLVVVLFVGGIVGTVMPALPGTLLVFLGVLLGAWIDDFARVSTTTVFIAAGLCLLAQALDYVAAMLGAKRAGASKEAVIGALIGTVAGILGGFVGLLFFPLIGAAVGEYIAISDLRRAGNVGIATWLGMIVGAVLKLALAFITIGLFIAALIF
ncbi:MAG: DUF456 domain-containing protein [Burkholderiaceae bacterium]